MQTTFHLEAPMTVNATSWRKFPVADRELPFDADDAIARIVNWASGSVEKFSSAFLWRNSQGAANNRNSYRLPVADVINGRLTLIPHAVFSAATILSGAHGALAGVVDDEEKKQLKGVITEIYAVLQKEYGDPRVVPPWLRGGNKEQDVTASIVASVNSSGFSSMPIADADTSWSGDGARAALWQWADGDFRKYRKGFLWWDQAAPDQKSSYKLPIATVVDGQLKLVPRAVTAVAQVLAGGRGGVDIPDDDMGAVQAVVNRLQKRLDVGEDATQGESEADDGVTAAAVPVAPPRDWFEDPGLDGPTPIVVTADGRVFGHLASWGVCHAGIGNKCVQAPRSATGYKYFRNGTVVTADGAMVRVGKITLGTGHADTRLGYVPASDHYDNTGTAVAVVASGEDKHGIWVAGALTPDSGEMRAAQLRRSPLSGDWRRINGNLELVAALAVNTPGFPIISLNASGEPVALCAAGVILEDGTIMAAQPLELERPDQERAARLERIEAAAAALTRSRLARRYNNIVAQRKG
jgi:hypothetical protein